MYKKIKNFFQLAYLKLVRINDTPQKIALGLGLGVFAGVLPGLGPVAALGLAFIFKANRAAAFLGGLFTNTWISLVTFILAIKLGSAIFKVSWQSIYKEWLALIRDFHLHKLFSPAILKTLLPVITGYFLISLCAGFITYLAALTIIRIRRVKK